MRKNRRWQALMVAATVVFGVFATGTAANAATGGTPIHMDKYQSGQCVWSGSTLSVPTVWGPASYAVGVYMRQAPYEDTCTLGATGLPSGITMSVFVEETNGLNCAFYACDWFNPNVSWHPICSASASEWVNVHADYGMGGNCTTDFPEPWEGFRVRYAFVTGAAGNTSATVQSYPFVVVR